MHVHVFTPGFSACKYQYICIVYDKPIDWCSINCSHASIHAHTPHHVHKSLYTLMCFLYDKLVVHYEHLYFRHCLHAFTRCMFMYSFQVLVHVSTNISASSTINRSNDVPLIVSMQVYSWTLIIVFSIGPTLQPHYAWHAATYHVYVYWYIHINTNKYYYPACLCIVFRTKNRSTDVPLIVPMQVFVRILLIMCTNHCTL